MYLVTIVWNLGEPPSESIVSNEGEAYIRVSAAMLQGAYSATFEKV